MQKINTTEQFSFFLDKNYHQIVLLGHDYPYSLVLKKTDPILFEQAKLEFIRDMIDNGVYYTEDYITFYLKTGEKK